MRGAMVGFELLGLLFALVWFCGWLRVVWWRMFWWLPSGGMVFRSVWGFVVATGFLIAGLACKSAWAIVWCGLDGLSLADLRC